MTALQMTTDQVQGNAMITLADEMPGMPMEMQSDMHEMAPGIDWFPPWLTILVSILLLGAALHHVPCVIRGHGNRWFHLGHIVMCLSMIYMYLIMSFRPPESWGPDVSRAQMWFFVVISALVLAYLVSLLARRRSFSLLWLLLLAQQAGMIYMWLPMASWSGLLSVVLIVWFVAEAIGWLSDIFRGYSVVPPGAGSDTGSEHSHTAGDDAYLPSGWPDRLAMAFMALSMAYMFFGMQGMAGFSL